MLEGYKTYIIAAVAVLTAILGYFSDQLTLLQALEAIGIAVGFGGNRAVVWAGQVLNSPYVAKAGDPSPAHRQLVTYLGVGLAILTAVLAAIGGDQPLSVTIATILSALGLNFVSLGAKKQAEGVPPGA
jgi:hypothetical protein